MDHSEPIFLQLKILDIYKINDYLCSLFMYRFNYCQILPDFCNDYFKQNNELHNYNTRNSTKLHVSYKRTNYRKYTVFNKGVSIWNWVPGHFAERHFAERRFAEWAFCRTDSLPNGQLAENTVEILLRQKVWDCASFLNFVILNHCVK
jgi:hypothetical protein